MTPSILVQMPTNRPVPPRTVGSLVGLLIHTYAAGVLRGFGGTGDCYISEARNESCRMALAGEYTHLLFLDEDMVWPEGAAMILLTHSLAHGHRVVGGLYFKDAPSFDCVHLRDGKPLQQIGRGLEQVDVLGMGCTLIETALLREMKDRYGDEQWFRVENNGEDVWFANRCREMGVKLWLDAGLECGHLKEYEVTRNHWEAKQAVAATAVSADTPRNP